MLARGDDPPEPPANRGEPIPPDPPGLDPLGYLANSVARDSRTTVMRIWPG